MKGEPNDLGAPELDIKMYVLRDDLKRMFIYWQLFKASLEAIRTSETLTEWSEAAKASKNKKFVDFRKLAADQLNVLNTMLLRMKMTIDPKTWNAIMNTLTSEQVKEIDLLLNEITELREDAIEGITDQIKEAKVRANIPLNDPLEQQKLKQLHNYADKK